MDKMDTLQCGICGSYRVKKEPEHMTVQAPYGSVEKYSYTIIKCESCEEDVDGDDHDSAMTPAINRSVRASVSNMLKFFKENGVSEGSLERVFGLDRGAISRYQQAEVIEPSFVMLLLTYREFFPNLLDCADAPGGFNRYTIQKDLTNE